MSRLADVVLGNNKGHSKGHKAPMLDLQYGGQMGYAPDLTEWVSNQAYVRRNLICVLVEAPKGFQMLPNPEYWVGTLRSLVELHPLSITGLNAGLEVETVSNPVGGAGQQQEDFSNVTETQSQISFRWGEKYGMPVFSFLRGWITNLMMDPATKFANIATVNGSKPTDMLADMYAATMLFMEPDPTMTKVVKSWLVTNMFPKSTGEVTGQRDLTQAGEAPSYDVQFSGIAQFSLGVDEFAQRILDGIKITGANPYHRAAFIDKIAADVIATKRSFTQSVDTLASQAISV